MENTSNSFKKNVKNSSVKIFSSNENLATSSKENSSMDNFDLAGKTGTIGKPTRGGKILSIQGHTYNHDTKIRLYRCTKRYSKSSCEITAKSDLNMKIVETKNVHI